MKIPSTFISIPKLKHNFGADEFNRLVDLFPTAGFVIDKSDLRVVNANSRAVELTSYMKGELTGKRLRDLFADDRGQAVWEERFADQELSALTLLRHNKSTLEVLAKFDAISSDGRWVFASLEPSGANRKKESDRQRYSQLLGQLRELMNADQQSELDAGLALVLKTGQTLLAASSGAIYQVNGKNMELRLQASTDASFPEELPASDMLHLHTPQVWTPGKRSQVYLHNLAKATGLAYVASVPVGDPHAIIGVLVFTGSTGPPLEQTIPLLHILAGSAHNIIQHFSKVSHLTAELEEQKSLQRIVDVAQNAVQDGIIVLGQDLKVMMLNQAAELHLGYKQKEAERMHVQDILVGSDNLKPALQIAQQGIPTLQQDNITLIRRSGETFLATVSTLPVTNHNRVEGFIVLIQDRSEEEHARIQAEQLQQQALLGTVTAMFAHEVRNPLNSLSTGLQLLAYQMPLDDPQRELVVKMQADCDRLDDLMKNVLTFARSTEYDMEPVDLGALVGKLLDRMNPRLMSAKVTHHLKVDSGTPLVMGNPRALEQVFTNLFNNALQSMESTGGVLGVKVQPTENTGKRQFGIVTVADNGPGIPKENLDRIFNPFFTTKSTGTGLGLAITKRIVNAHKGIILASSVPGATIFTVQIPAIQQTVSEQ